MTAMFVYKCRHCGKLFNNGSVCSVEKAEHILTDMIIFGKDMSDNKELYGDKAVRGIMVHKLDTHRCFKNGKAVGLADLVGYEIEKD